MERTLTHLEAWQDFYAWMRAKKQSGEIRAIPKDIQEAQYAKEGKRRHGLGEKRIKNLLTKYAPERYEFREAVILKDA